MKKIISAICLMLLASFFAGCKKVDLTASYIYIDTGAFEVNVSQYNNEHNTNYDQGQLASIANQKFPDAWIFVNGKDLGTWELPCKIPILETDSAEVMIYPGVKLNGVSTSRPRYPFVEPYKRKLGLKASEVLEIGKLPLKYASTTKFEFIENFDTDYNGIFTSSDSTTVNFEHIVDPDNPANRIGRISLVDTVDGFEIISSNGVDNVCMDFDGKVPSYVFLEMDYKCDVEDAQIYVGMLIDKSTTSVTTYEPLVIVNASSQWKKIYINLTQSVARNQIYAKNYRVQLSGGRSDDNPVHFYFDNIKVIYQ